MTEQDTIAAAELYATNAGLKFTTDDLPCVTIKKGRKPYCYVTAHPVTFKAVVRMCEDYLDDNKSVLALLPRTIQADIAELAGV